MPTSCSHHPWFSFRGFGFLGTGVLVLAFFSGCALQQDVNSLDHRLAALERHSIELEKQNQELRGLLSADASAASSLSDDRQRYAELAARIQADEDQIRSFSGRLDEIAHDLSLKAEDTETVQQRMEKLSSGLEALQRRMTAAEQKLKVQSQVVAPVVQTTPPPVVTVPTSATGSEETDTALYEAAKKQFDTGNRAAARKSFEAFLTRYPKSSLANNAQFWIAETYYQEKWYEKAILEYQKVIENYPSGSKRPAALLKQAYSFLNINETGNARLILKDLVAQYPSTEEGAAAQKKLDSLQ
ncbi:tol-pal system protein YbgF [Desulfosarcina sp. OttesenSCG-928-G10]|nr:tol-pal system protein YbgF [Desulfosarcina sp. OttesenSCG-928-G10]MDL2320785.1 tol-pal system protein YbgF [Desulfosarcina sp. OttesenSCG-928-B08]